MRDGLWEREQELLALHELLSDVTTGFGRLLVIEGPAGAGKSQLLLSARREAEGLAILTLAGRGLELERGVPFGLARQLFLPRLLGAAEDERLQLLSGPAAPAGLLLGESPANGKGVGEGQAGALVEGLYWLAANLARTAARKVPGSGQPGLLLIVDDAQWADRSSLRFLIQAVGQLAEVTLGVLLAVRTGEADAPADLLGRLRAHPGAARLRPAALSESAVAEVVRAGGFPAADMQFCQACAHVTGGNPFLLHELLAVLRSDGITATAEAAHRVSELVPDSVLDAVVISLGRLPEQAARLASAVAILDEGALPIAAELAGLGIAEAEDAADVLTAAQLLNSGEPLSLIHPLISAAVLADLPERARARAHRQAAMLLSASGAEVGRVAVHLLNTRPSGDPWASETLRAAGQQCLLHSENRSAVKLLRRALDEPPPPELHAAILVELAQAEAADDSPHAVNRLVQALESVHDPGKRADAYNQLARLLFFKGEIAQSAEAAERGLDELGPADPLASQLISAQLTASTFDTRLRPGVTDRLAPYLEPAREGRPPSDPLICAHLCARMAIQGDPAALVRPVAEAAFSRHPLVDGSAHGVVLAFPIVALVMIDELDLAGAALERAFASDRAQSSLILLTVAHHWRSVVDYRRGELVDAKAHGQRALASMGTEDWDLYGPWIDANLAMVALERGDLAGAGAVLGAAAATGVDPIGRCLQLEARGRLALDSGDPSLSLEHFTAAGQALEAMGLRSSGFVSWQTGAVQSAVRLGDLELAGELARQEVERARRTGVGRVVGMALRTQAMTTEGEKRLQLLTDSCAALQRSPSRLELARSQLELGAALRSSGRRTAARIPLRHALDVAAGAGAEPLEKRIREELAAAGARPRRAALTGWDALTPTERRIAQLAAAGRNNVQIAHDLYVTSKTVEWHLGNVFRKLEITRRSELTAAREAS
ncbi:MAG TPA: AAA family ATPase [Frankiaceae bacterium]|jgi:DNA-binding CsgD family transcriptional regulator|nr:AAA family ATPase [Frankiaceae bacterium]